MGNGSSFRGIVPAGVPLTPLEDRARLSVAETIVGTVHASLRSLDEAAAM